MTQLNENTSCEWIQLYRLSFANEEKLNKANKGYAVCFWDGIDHPQVILENNCVIA